MTLRRLLLVVLGGTIGTAARLAIAAVMPEPTGFPLATLFVNVLGALLIGILAAQPLERRPGSGGGPAAITGAELRMLLGTGMLGGFTTYSAFAVGTVMLWIEAPAAAGAYVVVTLLAGFAAVALGLRIGTSGPPREEHVS